MTRRSFLSLVVGPFLLPALLSAGCFSVVPTQCRFAAEIARQEARRRGWKRLHVMACRFEDGLWYVYLSRHPLKGLVYVVVTVSPAGTVVGFFVNSM